MGLSFRVFIHNYMPFYILQVCYEIMLFLKKCFPPISGCECGEQLVNVLNLILFKEEGWNFYLTKFFIIIRVKC